MPEGTLWLELRTTASAEQPPVFTVHGCPADRVILELSSDRLFFDGNWADRTSWNFYSSAIGGHPITIGDSGEANFVVPDAAWRAMVKGGSPGFSARAVLVVPEASISRSVDVDLTTPRLQQETGPQPPDKGEHAMNTIASASATASMSSMSGMEHVEDRLGVPPLLDPRITMQFCRAIKAYAERVGLQAEATTKLRQVRERLENLRRLASLCRLAILGHPGSFERALDELTCLAVDFPSDPLQVPQDPMAADDEPDQQTQFAAVIDLLAGAAFVSKGDALQRDRLIIGIVRAVENAISFPLAYSSLAATYIGADSGELSGQAAATAIGNATQRLLEGDYRCDPAVPMAAKTRLYGLANKWMAANPVTELFGVLTGQRLDGIIESITPDDAKVGDLVTLHLRSTCVDDVASQGPSPGGSIGDVIVLFSPRLPAKIVGVVGKDLNVAVPERARTGPVVLVRRGADALLADVLYLLERYACEYPTDWIGCVFSLIPMSIWAYPVAFGSPVVEIEQVPKSAIANAFNRFGPVSAQNPARINDPVSIQFQVDPPGSDANVEVEMRATAGTVTRSGTPGVVVFNPTATGLSTVDLLWGPLQVSLTVPVTAQAAAGRAQ